MNTWERFLEEESKEAYFQKLMQYLDIEYKTNEVYPPYNDLFTCFQACSYEDVKVVILGQDPYHQPSQAHGLCFSVRKGIKIPPSLKNIYKELQSDVNVIPPNHGYLIDWAKQGVFLMNAVMSVRANKAGSHQKQGWEIFSDHVMQKLNEHESGIVFVLWGNWAKSKATLITNSKHKLLFAPHPSPLSAYHGFFGSRPFSQINTYLLSIGRTPIEWKIED